MEGYSEEDNKQELLIELIINNFSEYIEVSKKRRAKPYVQGKCRVPKKYQSSDYHWIKKGQSYILARVSDGLVMTSNNLSVGKPRYKKVNGQDIYNGNVSRQARASLVKKMHEFFIPYLKNIKPLEDIDLYPLHLRLEFYIHDKSKSNIDNDNKWPWRKTIQDTLTELKIIPDDNVNIINENSEKTVLIPDDQEQKLIIKIYGKQSGER